MSVIERFSPSRIHCVNARPNTIPAARVAARAATPRSRSASRIADEHGDAAPARLDPDRAYPDRGHCRRPVHGGRSLLTGGIR
jgi:hypothetical protein